MSGSRLNIPYLSSIITHQSRNLLQSSIIHVNQNMCISPACVFANTDSIFIEMSKLKSDYLVDDVVNIPHVLEDMNNFSTSLLKHNKFELEKKCDYIYILPRKNAYIIYNKGINF